MSQLSETDAYKQLLQITQNLLQELSPEQQILHKYFLLKKSVLAKVKSSSASSQSITQSIPHSRLLSAYKLVTRNVLECLTQFQTQIQGQMDKNNFLTHTSKLIKQIQRQIRIIGEQLNTFANNNDTSGLKGGKLMFKQQLNAIRFSSKQIQGKIQNMGLMIQVHRKMHQIILDASEKQAKTTHKEIEYNRRLNQMESVVDQVNDVRKFIQAYDVTQRKARKFQLARKNLAKVLFDI